MHLKIKRTSKFFVSITVKGRKFIINAEYFDAKNVFSHRFIQNLKHRPSVAQYLTTPMQKALKKEIPENIVEQQVHQIQKINGRNGKKKTHGWAYAKKEFYVNQVGLVMLLSYVDHNSTS